MAHITADRVRETSTTTGTGAFTLAGAVQGFRAFSAVLAVNDTCYYTIADLPGTNWEVGIGTYSAASTLTRTTVLSSSNAGAAVSFGAGTKDVFITAAAGRFLQADSAGSYGNFSAGTISAALSGNASTSSRVLSTDTRAVTTTPETLAAPGLLLDFKQNSTESLSDGGTYFGEMTFRPYGTSSDWTGGGSHQLGFTNNANVWHRYGTGTTWGSWVKLYDTVDASTTNTASKLVLRDASGNINATNIVSSGGTINTTTYTSSEARIADGGIHLMKTVAGGVFEAVRAMNVDTTAGTTVRLLGAATSDPFNNANGGKVFVDAVRTSTNMDLVFSLNDVAGAAPVERVRISGNGNLLVSSGVIGTTNTTSFGFAKMNNGGVVQTYKIATLPISNAGTYDHVVITGVLDDNWGSTNKTKFEVLFSNRNGFTYRFYQYGDQKTNAKVLAYTETDTSITVWVSLAASTYSTISANVEAGINCTIYQGGVAGTPTGTLSFDSGANATYPPILNIGYTTPKYKENTIWHAGNDGSGSGLDADLLDGLNSSSANTVSTIVARDASGNFSAGTITATLSGNASTVTNGLYTTTNFGGDVSGTYNAIVVADNSHNHTSLTGVTSIGFAADASDSASLSTTINANGTYFDFNLTDDNNNDWWRWRFTPSGSTVYDAMTLKPSANGVANLVVAGSVTGTTLVSNVATGTAPLTVTSTTAVTNLNADLLDGNHASAFATVGQTTYVGTTAIALNRASAAQSLTGITSIDGSAASATRLTNLTSTTTTTAGTDNTESCISYINAISLFSQTDGALYSHVYSSSWKHNIYGDYRTGQLAIRGKNNGTWQAWRTVWDSSNLTNLNQLTNGPGYITAESDTLATVTGRGNSTTNPISAGYIGVNNTTNTNGYGISLYNGAVAGQPTYGLMFQGTGTFGTHGGVSADWATYFTMNNTANRGWIFRDVSTPSNVASISNAGLATFNNSVRTPIFYDSDNTGYYLDPASTSNLVGLTVSNTITGSITGNAQSLNNKASSLFQQRLHYGTTAGNTGYYKINIIPATSWMLSFTIRMYQSYKHYDIRISGYNYGANFWYTPTASLIDSSTDTNISITFGYDSAFNLWVAVPASSYTGLDIIDIVNGYTQVDQNWSDNFTITNMATLTGTVQTTVTAYRPLKYNEYTFDGLQSKTSGSGTYTTSGDYRAPIFYDSNNTAYYTDPASTSNLLGLTVTNTITGSISGNSGTVAGLSVHSGRNNEANKIARTDGNGYLQVGYINSSNGNENNASSPPRVWGTNGSDDYLRTYQTSSLSVGYATSAGSAPANGGTSSAVTINYNNDSNSTYQMLWGSGNSVYGTGGVYCNPSSDILYAAAFYDANDSSYYCDPNGTSHLGNVDVASRTLTSNYYDAAIEVREYNYGGTQTDSDEYQPRIAFHWGGRVASSISMNSSGWLMIRNNPGTGYENFIAANIYATGSVTAYYSDERLKTKVGKIENAVDVIKAIETFKYTNNDIAKANGFIGDDIQVGVSAQSVEKVLPEVVKHAPFDMQSLDGETISKTGEWYKTVQYDRLVPVLIEAIKEQQDQIDELKALVNALINKQ